MLITRIVTALVLLAIVVPALFIAPLWIWQLVVLVFMALAGLEWGRMLGSSKASSSSVGLSTSGSSNSGPSTGDPSADGSSAGAWLLAASLLLAGLLFIANPSSLALHLNLLSAVLIILASLFWILVTPFALRPSFSVRTGGLPLAFLLLLATWLAVTQLRAQGPMYVLSCLLIVWIADTFAYFSGRAFGKTKLAPSISPGKTWAGAYGGITGVAIYFLVLSKYGFSAESFPKTVLAIGGVFGTLAIAVVITAYSVIGDLFESKLKREVGVKDSGNTLPGHGGVLDRIDAVIAVLPICWVIDRLASGRLVEIFKLAVL
jgi:phosphatidate cytidylyltransferase